MITIAQRTKLKKLFKNGYAKDVQAILLENCIVNKKGVQFGESYIRHVFNGINSNVDIEDAIFTLYQKRSSELSKKSIERKRLLKKQIV